MNKATKDRFMFAMVTEPTIEKACNVSGISIATGYKYLKEYEFQNALEELKISILEGATNKLRGSLTQCADELLSIALNKDNSPQIRINAIQLVFNIFKQNTEIVDLQKRINELTNEFKEIHSLEGGESWV